MPNTLAASKLILHVAVVCVASAIGATAVADDNRLKNPGGEEASKEDKSVPASWFAAHVPAEGLTMKLDDKVVRAGKASLFVGNTHAYPQATFNNWAQRIEGLAAGESFTLSGWVKTENAETVSMCIQAWDEGGKNLVAFATTEAIIGTRDWQLIKTTPITIPQSAKLIIVRAGLGGKGKAWFDELRFSPGDGARFPEPPAEAGANLVVNPGAEDRDPQAKDDAAVWFRAQVPAEGLRMARVTEGAHGGEAALHIANTHDYGQMVCNNWTQTIPYNLAGKVVKLSAWVKTEDAEHVSLCVQGFSDLVNMPSFVSTEVVKGTQGWRRIESKPVAIGKSVTMTTVRAVLTGRGKVWFDDFSLEIVDEEPAAE
jgi:hypothetical protein